MARARETTARGGGRRRGPSKGDRTEAAILDVAWGLLPEKPLSSITISDLAQGAGISRSSFYFYFESKDAVVLALAQRVGEDIRAKIGGFNTSADGEIPDIRAGIEGYLMRWRELGPVLRAMAVLVESDESLRKFWDGITNEILTEVASSIERAQKAGTASPPPPAPEDLAHALFAMLWHTAHEFSLGSPTPDEQRRLVDTLTTVFQRTLGLPQPDQPEK
ncbi:TetR/AcrR family transcriptional regulator [Rhodococcus sp. IC4_135]|uniref:TetR/AcrR family transcriptional regulator n=1 Tax=Rhodococcus TaxID=1827 RepID=UPI00142199B2|nr:TetR/AcrR family transcriptional regulator [Rhodococcus erythropolis]NHP13924.1 TetR/AcrR family transcriptional regulator [Rhodococcus sp. IC4_135]